PDLGAHRGLEAAFTGEADLRSLRGRGHRDGERGEPARVLIDLRAGPRCPSEPRAPSVPLRVEPRGRPACGLSNSSPFRRRQWMPNLEGGRAAGDPANSGWAGHAVRPLARML